MYGIAQVINQAPPDGVYVLMKSGQIPGWPVKVLNQGPCDPLRVKQNPLPTPGTWGLVVFSGEDYRNGFWVGSYAAQGNTAFNSTANPQDDYHSHYSGYWDLLDQSGNKSINFPDGTSINVSASGASPTTYRQAINPQQKPESVEFTAAQRNPNPPTAFYITINHPSGASVTVTPAGEIIVDAASGQKVNLTNGGTSASDAVALVSKLIAAFNAHVHTDPQGGDTGIPTVSWTPSTVESTVIGTNA